MKKIFIYVVVTMQLVTVYAADEIAATNSIATVYVIPIRGQIESALTYVIRRGLGEASEKRAGAVIFLMDTHGGRVDSTEEICKILMDTDLPLYTLVEHNAISAGAIIALTTDAIYMMPGSKIGDAMPIAMGQTLGDAEREKMESFVDTLVRANAEHAGHNKDLATAMVRRDFEFKIGKKLISPEGQILTLTNLEAEERYGKKKNKKPLLSSGTVDDLEALLVKLELEHAVIMEIEVSPLEQFARIIAMIAPILMMVGMACIYLEIQSPGIGIPAAMAALCFGLFFFGHHIAGLAGSEEILIFVIGVLLLLVELFVLPGFGIAGFLGAACILFSLFASMFETLPSEPFIPSWPVIEIPLLKLSSSIVLAGAAMAILSKVLPSSSVFNKLTLVASTDRKEGFIAADRSAKVDVGQTGITLTPLSPAGTAAFGNERLDVVTQGEYIDKNSSVKILEIHGSRIVVTHDGA